MLRPLETFASVIVKEYCSLRNQQSAGIMEEPSDFESPVSMCTFFDNVKSQLLKRWERDIVKKSAQFTQQ